MAHYTGGGIDSILLLTVDEYFEYLEAATEVYERELEIYKKTATPVYLVEIKK